MAAQAIRTVKFFVLGSFLILVGAACSGGGGGGGGGTGPDAPPAPKLQTCDNIITQEKIDALVTSGEVQVLGGLVGFGTANCEERIEKNGAISTRKVSGYASLVAVPGIKLTGRAEIRDNSILGRKAEIEIQRLEIKNEDIERIAKAFRSSNGKEKSTPIISIREPSISAVLLGNLPKTDAVVRHVPDGDNERLVIALDVPNNLAGLFQTALNSYVSGQPIVVYAEPDLARASILRGLTKAGSVVRVGEFKRVAISSYLSETWTKIAGLGSLGLDDKNLPYEWMREVHGWWPSMGLQPADAHREWKGAHGLASALWNPRAQNTDQIGAENALTALTFLMLLEPTNAAKTYADKRSRLRQFIPNGETLYREMILLVETRPYNAEQEEVIFGLAGRLQPLVRNEAWTKAKSLATRARFQQTTVDLVFEQATWIQSVERTLGLEKAETWVFEKGVDRLRFEMLKDFAAFLAGHSRQASQKAIEYVVEKKVSAEQIAAFKKVLEFLKTTSAGYRAFDKAEDYLSKLTAEQIEQIMTSHAWLKNSSAGYRALDKAEDYVINKKLSRADTERLQVIHDWAKNTSAGYRALDKAEDYVIVKKLSKDVTDAIVKAHEWLKTTSAAYRALDKTEDYLLVKKLAPAKIEQLKKVEQFLKTTSAAYRSLDVAEDLVIEKKLSIQQTDLLEEAHTFLKTTSAAYRAWDKALAYVVEKRMSAATFQKLRNSYDKHKKAGDYNALEKAEREAGL